MESQNLSDYFRYLDQQWAQARLAALQYAALPGLLPEPLNQSSLLCSENVKNIPNLNFGGIMKKYFPLLIVFAVVLIVMSCSEVDSQTKSKQKANVENKSGKAMETNFVLNFNEGLDKAAKEKKNMIVDFYTDWCHWCKVMDEKTFANDSVAAKLSKRFVTVRINAESPTEKATFQGKEFTNIELTQAFRVSGFPSLAFISPEMEVITVIPGYIQAEQFNHILDYIDQECYKKQTSFEEFLKRKGKCDDEQSSTGDAKKM